jgi:hypothetical protein
MSVPVKLRRNRPAGRRTALHARAISDKPEKNEKRLNEAVAKMFKQFPPARDTGTK